MQNTMKIVLTDPGIDDAIAILIAASCEKNMAFVATYGNGPTNTTSVNLRGLTKWITNHSEKSSLPLYEGSDRTLTSKISFKGEDVQFIHGKNLSEGLFENEKLLLPSSSDLYEEIEINKTPIDIVSLGATTELALILKRNALLPLISSITIMGGALYNQGNITPHVEANFSHDPSSFQLVLQIADETKIPLTIVPLDLTERKELQLTPERLAELTDGLGKETTEFLHKLVGINSTYLNFYKGKRGVYHYEDPLKEHRFNGCPIHDLTAYYVLIHPELFNIIKRPIIAGDKGEIIIPTAWMQKGIECNLAFDLNNPDKYWELTKKYLELYDN